VAGGLAPDDRDDPEPAVRGAREPPLPLRLGHLGAEDLREEPPDSGRVLGRRFADLISGAHAGFSHEHVSTGRPSRLPKTVKKRVPAGSEETISSGSRKSRSRSAAANG